MLNVMGVLGVLLGWWIGGLVGTYSNWKIPCSSHVACKYNTLHIKTCCQLYKTQLQTAKNCNFSWDPHKFIDLAEATATFAFILMQFSRARSEISQQRQWERRRHFFNSICYDCAVLLSLCNHTPRLVIIHLDTPTYTL